ncbi:MAG: PD-(D/E)XK nuclease family transposase [Methylococcales bacterium]
MAYTWADIYSQQLQSGQDYRLLKPTYSIWLLAENLIADEDYAHNYKLRDDNGRILIEHGGIWVLELAKFDAKSIATDQQRWLMFFKTGDQLDDANLPDWTNTEDMRKAMSTLQHLSTKNAPTMPTKPGKTTSGSSAPSKGTWKNSGRNWRRKDWEK